VTLATADAVPDAEPPDLVVCLLGATGEPPHTLLYWAAARGIPIISEIELAFRHKGKSKIIAITGSNGKSTTTALIFHICKTAGLNCALVGNIGYSFAKQIAEDPKELYVAEISSFQLDDIKEFRPLHSPVVGLV